MGDKKTPEDTFFYSETSLPKSKRQIHNPPLAGCAYS